MRIYSLYIMCVMLFSIGLACNAQTGKVSEELEERAFNAYDGIVLNKPSDLDPLSMGAKVVYSTDKKTMAIVMRAQLAYNWHIYAKDKGGTPFIITKIKTELPVDCQLLGEWVKPDAIHYDTTVDVYKGDMLFMAYFELIKPISLLDGKVGLYYQACDPSQCFSPKTKMIDLKF